MKKTVTTYICDGCGYAEHDYVNTHCKPSNWVVIEITRDNRSEFFYCETCWKEQKLENTPSVMRAIFGRLMK